MRFWAGTRRGLVYFDGKKERPSWRLFQGYRWLVGDTVSQGVTKNIINIVIILYFLVIHIGKDEVLAVTDSGISHFHKNSLLLEDKALVSVIFKIRG